MIRPIDMGVILKNIDEVARINKNKEVNLLNQQANALSKLEQQHKLEKSKVVNSKESVFNPIDINKNSKDVGESIIKKKKKKNNEKKGHKGGKDPNRGRWLDIDA